MKKIIYSLIFSICFGYITLAETKNFIDQPFIEVTGKAKQEIAPDKIFLSITIVDKENKAKKTVEQLEKEMFKCLKDVGIDVSKQLTVMDLSSNFKSSWYKGKDIVSTKQYELIVGSVQQAGNAIVTLEAMGISSIQLLRIDHSQIEKIKRDVKVSAVRDAQSKATDLLTAIGQKAGRALWILEVDHSAYRHTPMMMRAAPVMEAANANTQAAMPEIEFQKITVEYAINAKFAIE
ncbi:MAG: SIMPL domain-containing protein [Bacteroidales bacterium]